MSNAINTIQAANNGITAITKLVQSAQALTSQANQTTDTAVRATLSSQFDALVTQIGQLAGDAGFNGINLLAGDTLTVTLDETGSSSTSVVGANYTDATAAPLSITLSANSWAASADIQGATDDLTAALTSLRSESQTLSANLSTVQIRQDSRRRQSTRCRQALPTSPSPTSNEEGRTCLPWRPASNCRPPRCLSPRRPTRTCCGCSARPSKHAQRNGGLRAAVFFKQYYS